MRQELDRNNFKKIQMRLIQQSKKLEGSLLIHNSKENKMNKDIHNMKEKQNNKFLKLARN